MKDFNFDFGPGSDDRVRLSPYGLAIRNKNGSCVSYRDGSIIDVDIFNFDGSKYFYKIPVAIKDVATGMIIVHNRIPMFIKEVSNGQIIAVDPYESEVKTIIPVKSPFGFDFVTRIVSIFDFSGANNPSAENPFGNMLPFFLMNDNQDIDPMMFYFFSGAKGSAVTSNPMFFYFLMNKDEKNNKLLPFLLMNGNIFPTV